MYVGPSGGECECFVYVGRIGFALVYVGRISFALVYVGRIGFAFVYVGRIGFALASWASRCVLPTTHYFILTPRCAASCLALWR